MSSTVLALLYGAAFCVPFVATLGFTPIAGRVARRLGILDVPQQNKFHRQATPYLGGVAVAVGVVLVGAVAGSARGQLLTVLLCGLAVAVVGLVDDWRTVRPEMKLVVEIAAGLALWFVGIRASIFGVYELDLAMTVLWVVAVTNALNLVDNMDGLSSGLACICAFSFFALAASRGHYFRGSLALAIAGSSLAFLRYNFPPARIFLGDAGSLLLGFLLAALALHSDLAGKGWPIRAAVPVLILGVPLFDTLLVIVSRVRRHQPVSRGGTDHSSHRLVATGLSTRRVAVTLYGAQLASSTAALALFVLPSALAAPILVGLGSCAVAALVLFLRLDELETREAALRTPEWPMGWHRRGEAPASVE